MSSKSYIISNNINISEIDLIKIDVEMFEPTVLEGFEEILFSLNAFIFIEVLSNEIAEKLNQLFNSKFTFYHLQENETLIKCSKLSVVPFKWNYLACPIKKTKQFEENYRNNII